MCVMHTATALSCINLRNNNSHTINSLSTLTILWFERKALIQMLKLLYRHWLSIHCIFSLIMIMCLLYPFKTGDPSAGKWVFLSYRFSLLWLSVLVRKVWTWNYGVATGNIPYFLWQQYRDQQFRTFCCQWCELWTSYNY